MSKFIDRRLEIIRKIYQDYTMLQAANAIRFVNEPYNCVLCAKEFPVSAPEDGRFYPYCEECHKMVTEMMKKRKEMSRKTRENLRKVLDAKIAREFAQ